MNANDNVTISRDNVVFAGLVGDRLYVVTNAERDKYGRALCVTCWDDLKPHRWEATYENVGDDWTGVDDAVLREVDGRTYFVRDMISEY